jgi:hypothetical protein
MRAPWRLVVGLLLLLALASGPSAPAGAVVPSPQKEPALRAAWVQLGPEGVALARAITLAPACPVLESEGGRRPMRERAHPAPPSWPERVCELELPVGIATAAIEGIALALPQGPPRRLVVLGDTGCRIEPPRLQACGDAAAWPLAAIARQAAAWQPDLVLHVGDYLYREEPCPATFAGCRGSPWGDNWATWEADFFAPAAPLLQAAPWVFVRGNHELCARAGHGWFRALDPRPFTTCRDLTDPYAVPLGEQQLLVLDSAAADDSRAPAELVAAYAAQLGDLAAEVIPGAWLTTHRPIWGVAQGAEDGEETLYRPNATLQAAAQQRWPTGIQLVLSGHVHLFELLTYGPERPVQLVAGTGGTLLDRAITLPLPGASVAGLPIHDGLTLRQHGFVTLEARGEHWELGLHDIAGGRVLACTLRTATVECPR